jgi:hypothetical protein
VIPSARSTGCASARERRLSLGTVRSMDDLFDGLVGEVVEQVWVWSSIRLVLDAARGVYIDAQRGSLPQPRARRSTSTPRDDRAMSRRYSRSWIDGSLKRLRLMDSCDLGSTMGLSCELPGMTRPSPGRWRSGSMSSAACREARSTARSLDCRLRQCSEMTPDRTA